MKIDLLELFSIDSSLDEKSVNALIKAINTSHLKDFDYLKFKASVVNLQEIQPDETLRFKTTFTTAQTLGVSKKFLLDTATHYQNVIRKEKEKFSVALQHKMTEAIEEKKKEAEKITEGIVLLRQKIEQLQKDILTMEARSGSIDHEIEEAREKIKSTRDNFEKAITHFEKTISSDIEKMEQIL